jgi:hypothetical protein
MKVLDVFAGLGGWSNEARDRHEVFTIDWDPAFGCDLTIDVLELMPDQVPWSPDVVLASPPCETFSSLGARKHWTGANDWPPDQPITRQARMAYNLVAHTLNLIEAWAPFAWVIENPQGRLRSLDVLAGRERRTVTYCRYGAPFRKPTDLWGGFPPSLELLAPCGVNDGCHLSGPSVKDGDERTRRGSLHRTKRAVRQVYGTSNQQQLAAMRAKVPTALARDVIAACERDMAASNTTTSTPDRS